jgi:hypothetical protein
MDRENRRVLALGGALGLGMVLGLAFGPNNSEDLKRIIERASLNPACQRVISEVMADLKAEAERD